MDCFILISHMTAEFIKTEAEKSSVISSMFEGMADEIFADAGVSKVGNEDFWNQTVDILSTKMAMLSGMGMGITQSRINSFEAQKQTLRDDLIKMKKEGVFGAYNDPSRKDLSYTAKDIEEKKKDKRKDKRERQKEKRGKIIPGWMFS